MSTNREPSSIDAPGPDVVSVDEDMEAEDFREASGVARIWLWVVPVVVVHLALIYPLARSAFDFNIPAYLHVDGIAAWLWVNGGAIGLGIWFWKKGRIPIAAGKWLRGRRARSLILFWLGGSLAWFLLPAILNDMWDAFSAWLTVW